MTGPQLINEILRESGVSFETEFMFAKSIGRRWRFDWALPEKRIAIEYEGGVYTFGRHTRGKGYSNDAEKYNYAQRLGWKVYRFTGEMMRKGKTIDFIREILR